MACADCFTGYLRTDQTPNGSVNTIYSLPTYITQPSSGQTKGLIVMIADAFGWSFANNRLLADTYAAAGFRVYLPDFMAGSPAPAYFLDVMDRLRAPSSWTDRLYMPYDIAMLVYGMVPFFWKNLIPSSHPRVTKFLESVRTMPLPEDTGLKVGVAGFCWGGKHAIMLTHKDEAHLADAVFTGHPGWLKLPEDMEKVTVPLSFAIGDKDQYLLIEQVREAESILNKLSETAPDLRTEFVVYENAGHGFTSRIDIKNARQAEQSRQAAEQATGWFEQIFG